MADKSKIEWTDATWNIITGCSMVSAGCTNCYAMGLAGSRLRNHPSRAGLTRETGGRHVWTGEVRFNEEWLDQPLRWRNPRRIFVCAHGDLFHEAVPNEWIDRVFAVMALCPQHTFQVLTKRPERMREYVTGDAVSRIVGAYAKRLRSRGHGECKSLTAFDIACDRIGLVEDFEHADIVQKLENRGLARGWPLPNVWLGTSIEDHATADARIPHLLATPAAIRFVSAEPLLGRVDLTLPQFGEMHCAAKCKDACRAMGDDECPKHYGLSKLDLVIVGGESGPRARAWDGFTDAARSLRDQCHEAGVAFFMKQMAGQRKAAMPPIPDDLMIRELPNG